MALTFKSAIGVFSNSRKFDNTWNFEYITLTTDGKDATDPYTTENIEEDKSKYPPGTIFFDSDVSAFIMQSSVKNVYIDKVPITVTSNNIQHTSLNGIHHCSIVFDSKTPIDPGNLHISLGFENDITLYNVNRKDARIYFPDGSVTNVKISRNADLYTLTFDLNVNNINVVNDEKLNELQLYVTVWNIAGTRCTFNTTADIIWKTIITEADVGDASPLIISFVDPHPENRIVYPPNEGSIKVIVQNPNPEFFGIEPTIILEEDSIGIIDKSSYGYDEKTGIATFFVRPITETGFVVVSAWLSIDNTEVSGALKNKTFATGMDGEWIGATEGRLIKFKQNVPKYLKNDNYASFIQATEDFFNTIYTSMTNGKHISILEKFARINNFNDVKAMEAPLIDLYRKQYGIHVQPNNDDLNYYLRNKRLPDPSQENKPQNDSYREPFPDPIVRESRRRALRASPLSAETPSDTDTEVLKDYVFQDITGLELNSFIKDIYKNIPYYNQMSGTYRGIKFILDQMGLCVKLVEIWSTRDIVDNFEHSEDFAREDELHASRHDFTTDQLSDIGRYYLTSRFDVDVMETGLTFREFNELSYNIVKLILQVKPIHRVLRKLAYVHVTNTYVHFQHFLLDKLGGSQEVVRYKYTWNLFDLYAVHKITTDDDKNHIWVQDDNIKADMLFFPFNTVDAQYYHNWERYNAYGEDFGIGGASNPTNDYAVKFFNPHKYIDTPSAKPYFNVMDYDSHVDTNAGTKLPNGYATASKNSYNNLFNIEDKLRRSHCKKIKVSFCYVSVVSNYETQSIELVATCRNAAGQAERKPISSNAALINSINDYELTFYVDGVKYKLSDYVLGKYNATDVAKIKAAGITKDPADIWSPAYEFTLGHTATIKSETNGFRFYLNSGAQTVLSEVGVTKTFNELNHEDTSAVTERPVCLLAKIEDFYIALGTDYMIFGEPITINK